MIDPKEKYNSLLKNEIASYLLFRANQGHDAKKEETIFVSLDRYIATNMHFPITDNISPELVEGWIESLPKSFSANTINLYISHFKQFARYLNSKGYSVFLPERSLPDMTYIPYIFSSDEQRRLISAADKRVETSRPSLRHNSACFSVLLRMLVGCGFRINELLNLKTSEVDLDNGIITVKDAKGSKDRIVPVHETLLDTLYIFMKSGIPQHDGYFFTSYKGKKLSYSWARDNFNFCIADIGIVKPDLKSHARNICIHCLRHSYAVSVFQKFDQDNKDLYSEAPIISTYLGHKNIYGTEIYLHMTASNNSDVIRKMETYNKGLFPEVSL